MAFLTSQFLISMDVWAPQYKKNKVVGVPNDFQDVKALVKNIGPMSSPSKKYMLLQIDIMNKGADRAACNLLWPLALNRDLSIL